MKTYSTLFLF
jgi:hypothetical protein